MDKDLEVPGRAYSALGRAESGAQPAPAVDAHLGGISQAEQFFTRGEGYRAEGDLPVALACYNEALRCNPKHYRSLLERAQLHAQTGRLEAALLDSHAAVDLEPDHAENYTARAYPCANPGRHDDDARGYSAAILFGPADAAAPMQPRFDDAGPEHEAPTQRRSALYAPPAPPDSGPIPVAPKVDPPPRTTSPRQRAADYFAMAETYRKLDDCERAFFYFGEALRCDPLHVPTLLERARLHALREEFAAALEDIDAALVIDPQKAEAYHLRGDLFTCEGRYEEAVKEYTAAIRLVPEAAEALMQRVLALAPYLPAPRPRHDPLRHLPKPRPPARLARSEAVVEKSVIEEPRPAESVAEETSESATQRDELVQETSRIDEEATRISDLPPSDNTDVAGATSTEAESELAVEPPQPPEPEVADRSEAVELSRPEERSDADSVDLGASFPEEGTLDGATGLRAADAARTALALGDKAEGALGLTGELAPLPEGSAEPVEPAPGRGGTTFQPARRTQVRPPGELEPGAPAPVSPADKQLQLGLAAQQRRDHIQAIANFSETLRLAPGLAAAHLGRGRSLLYSKCHDDAFADFNAVISADPKHAEAYLCRGNLYLRCGQLDEAIADYTLALEHDDSRAEAYLNRGLARARQGKHAEAVEDADQARHRNPNLGASYYIRAVALSQQGLMAQAIVEFNRLLELEPKNVIAYNDRGLAYAQSGRFKEAIKDYAMALRLDPKFVLARYNRAMAYRLNNDHDMAIADFGRVQKLAPRKFEVYYNRGLSYMAKNDFDAAAADFRIAQKLQPNHEAIIRAHNEARLGRQRQQRDEDAEQQAAPPPPPEQEPVEKLASGSAAAALAKMKAPSRPPISSRPAPPSRPARKTMLSVDLDDEEKPAWRRYGPYAAAAAASLLIGSLLAFNLQGSEAEEYPEVLSDTPMLKIGCSELSRRFEENASECEKYKDQVLQVSGTVHEVSTSADRVTLILQEPRTPHGAVHFAMARAGPAQGLLAKVEKGRHVTVKGLCNGYSLDGVKLIGGRVIQMDGESGNSRPNTGFLKR